MKKYIIAGILALITGIPTGLQAQGTAINPSGAAADSSAMLDISATDKGLLIPRIALTDTTDALTVQMPATSLLIYNTSSGNGLFPGFYYNSGTSANPRWKQLLSNPAGNEFSMANFKITDLATCTQNLDAANKAYVDAQIAQVGGSGGSVLPTMISDESPSAMTFRVACEYCKNLTEGGYTDWWMPSFSEFWHAVINQSTPINNITSSNWLWIMEIDRTNFTNLGIVRILDGYSSNGYGYNSYRVRCVR